MPLLPNPFAVRDIAAKKLAANLPPELAEMPILTTEQPHSQEGKTPDTGIRVSAHTVGTILPEDTDKDREPPAYASLEIRLITYTSEHLEEEVWALVRCVETRCSVAGINPRIQYCNMPYSLRRPEQTSAGTALGASSFYFTVFYDDIDSEAVDIEAAP